MGTTQKTTPITLNLTERAAEEVRKFMAEEKVAVETAGLRIGVLPGGCWAFAIASTWKSSPKPRTS
jgi:Fe-S cluster assembly iron-binding protein IscA